MRRLLCASFVLGFFINQPVFSESNPRKTLKSLNSKIANVQSELFQKENERKKYLTQLKKNELAFSKIFSGLRKTSDQIAQRKKILNRLNRNAALYQKKLSSERMLLAQHLRSAYLLGHDSYFKVLLSQPDANQIGRMMMYYRYISQDRLKAINELQHILNLIERNQAQIQTQTKNLEQLKNRQQQEQTRLQTTKLSRERVVIQLNQEIEGQELKLKHLRSNKKRLENTLNRLNLNPMMVKNGDFFHLKGQLSLPVRGQITTHFGSLIDQSELKWDGILIRTLEGSPVAAIADGTVIFAKWLPGYGLLLILNHGNGYMSLYGRNRNITKKVGDSVHRGEIIANVGQSGGYDIPALYFAVRYNAKPLNPLEWCNPGR